MNDDIDIQKLAELARVDLSGTDEAGLRESMTGILQYVASVEDVAAEQASKPAAGPVRNVLRDDENPHEPGAYTEELLAEVPQVDNAGHVVVPPILN